MSACNKQPVDPQAAEDASWYHWHIERDSLKHSGITSDLYEDGYFFIISVDSKTGDQFFTKVDERNGDFVFEEQIVTGGPLPNPVTAHIHFYDGKIIYIYESSIYHLDKSDGHIIDIDIFPNHIWRYNLQDDYFSGCSYAGDFTLFRFYEFVYDGSNFSQRDIHREYFTHSNGNIDAGSAPCKTKDGWVMIYTTSETLPDIIIVENGQVERHQIHPAWGTQVSFRLAIETDDFIYFNGIEDIFKISKSNPRDYTQLSLSYTYRESSFFEYRDHIYYSPRDSRHEKIVKLNIQTDEVTEFVTEDPIKSYPTIINDTLYYTRGQLQRFDLIKEEFIPHRDDEYERIGYFSNLTISPNAKILNNENGWFCTPLKGPR